MKHSTAPQHLSTEAKGLWERLVRDFQLSDSAGQLLLRNALEAHDRLTEAREILKRDGVMIVDRFGCPKQHPATLIERDARSQVLAALRLLKLEPGSLE